MPSRIRIDEGMSRQLYMIEVPVSDWFVLILPSIGSRWKPGQAAAMINASQTAFLQSQEVLTHALCQQRFAEIQNSASNKFMLRVGVRVRPAPAPTGTGTLYPRP